MKKKVLMMLLFVFYGFIGFADETYYQTGKIVITAIYQQKYDIVLENFDNTFLNSINQDELKKNLETFHDYLISYYSNNMIIKPLEQQKYFGLFDNKKNTLVNFIIEDSLYYNYVSITFNELSNKITYVHLDGSKRLKPDTNNAWTKGIIPFLVFGFNIFVIVLLMTSKMQIIRKLLLSLLTFIVNTPSIIISGHSGSLKLFQLKMFLGIEYSKFGYDVQWGFGIPIGGIFALLLFLEFQRKRKFNNLNDNNIQQ